MNRIIRINADSISYASKKIKKKLNNNILKHNEILNILSKALDYDSYNDLLKKEKDSKYKNKELDIADLISLDYKIKKAFSEYGVIETIPYIKREKDSQVHIFKTHYNNFNIVDYIRLYNGINERNINDNLEIKSYEDVVRVIPELVNDLKLRYIHSINILGDKPFPFCSFNDDSHNNMFEPSFFSQNRNLNISNLIFKSVWLSLKGDSDEAIEILNQEVKKIFIEHQRCSDSLTLIKKFPIYTPTEKDNDRILKYSIASKDELIYIGKENQNWKSSFEKIKNKITNKDHGIYLKKENAGSHMLLFGAAGCGKEQIGINYVFQSVAKGNGFVYFGQNDDYQGIEDRFGSFVNASGKGNKLITLSQEQFYKLRDSEIQSFINKNKKVYIKLKNIEKMNIEERNKQEFNIKHFFQLIASNSCLVSNEQYLISFEDYNSFSNGFYSFMTKNMEDLSKKYISLILQTPEVTMVGKSSSYSDFIASFYYKFIFRSYEFDLFYLSEEDRKRIDLRDIISLRTFQFMIIENNILKHYLYQFEIDDFDLL